MPKTAFPKIDKIQLDGIVLPDADGSYATIPLPVGRDVRIRKIVVKEGDTNAGDANAPAVGAVGSEFKLLFGTKEQRRVSAAHAEVIHTRLSNGGSQYVSQAYAGGGNGEGRRHTSMFFEEPWRKNTATQDGLALQTGWMYRAGIDPVLKVKMATGKANGGLIEAYAVIDDFDDGGDSQNIMKWYTDELQAVGAAPSWQLKWGDSGDLVEAVLFDTSDGKTVDRVEIKHASRIIYDLFKNDAKTDVKGYDMIQAAGAFHVVFDASDILNDARTFAGLLNLKATLSAAANGTLEVVRQVLGRPD